MFNHTSHENDLQLRMATDWSHTRPWNHVDKPSLSALAKTFGLIYESELKTAIEALQAFSDLTRPADDLPPAIRAKLESISGSWQTWIATLEAELLGSSTQPSADPNVDILLSELWAAAEKLEVGNGLEVSTESAGNAFVDALGALLDGLWCGTAMLRAEPQAFLDQVRQVEWQAAARLARHLLSSGPSHGFTGDDKLAMAESLGPLARLHALCLSYAPAPSLLAPSDLLDPPRRVVVYRTFGLVDREVWGAIDGQVQLEALRLDQVGATQSWTVENSTLELHHWPGGPGGENRLNMGTSVFAFWLDAPGPFAASMLPEEGAGFAGEIQRDPNLDILPDNAEPLTVSVEIQQNGVQGTRPAADKPTTVSVEINDNKFHGILPAIGEAMTASVLINKNRSHERQPPDEEPMAVSFEIQQNEADGRLPGVDRPTTVSIEMSDNNFRGTLPAIGEAMTASVLINNNLFHGSLPPIGIPASGPTTVEISANRFHGTLPAVPISGEISANRFHGTLPPIGNSGSGHPTVEISPNLFHGTLPPIGIPAGGNPTVENSQGSRSENADRVEDVLVQSTKGEGRSTFLLFIPWGRQLDPS